MFKSVISGVGHYVPENIVTNDDLSKLMTTNDEWITERTGIKERRHRKNRVDAEETTSCTVTSPPALSAAAAAFAFSIVWKGATCVPAALSLPLTGSTQSACASAA